MTKSDYISNSAKVLCACSILLLLANVLSVFGETGSQVDNIGQKLSTFSFYVVFILSFISFNGEGIAHKRNRSFRRKRVTTLLKVAVLFAFLYRYIKVYVIKLVRVLLLLLNDSNATEDVANIGLAVINTAASYGFVLMLVSLWYVYRDSSDRRLFPFASASFIVSAVYNVYKIFYYAVTNYGVASLGEGLTSFFSNADIYHGLCIVQYTLNAVMFLAVAVRYSKKASEEQVTFDKMQKKLIPARSIYNTDCVGIDTLDDDY